MDPLHRRTCRCGVLAIATWAAWFWAAQGQLLTKKNEERKGQKGRFNIFATACLRTQSAPDPLHSHTCESDMHSGIVSTGAKMTEFPPHKKFYGQKITGKTVEKIVHKFGKGGKIT